MIRKYSDQSSIFFSAWCPLLPSVFLWSSYLLFYQKYDNSIPANSLYHFSPSVQHLLQIIWHTIINTSKKRLVVSGKLFQAYNRRVKVVFFATIMWTSHYELCSLVQGWWYVLQGEVASGFFFITVPENMNWKLV